MGGLVICALHQSAVNTLQSTSSKPPARQIALHQDYGQRKLSNPSRESALAPGRPHYCADTLHNAAMGRGRQTLSIPVQDGTVDIARHLIRPMPRRFCNRVLAKMK